jgi:2-keto-4-pentenoate hydratase/2-oxohepta-3-ene-1,7-dioic acid hydratase in catechol pathway
MRIRAIQDGECIREGWSNEQFWSWPKVISQVSQWMTLNPYDVILTGNVPDTVGMRYLGKGAVFDAEISGLGVLTTVFVNP